MGMTANHFLASYGNYVFEIKMALLPIQMDDEKDMKQHIPELLTDIIRVSRFNGVDQLV
jgi:hypothetical protein